MSFTIISICGLWGHDAIDRKLGVQDSYGSHRYDNVYEYDDDDDGGGGGGDDNIYWVRDDDDVDYG